MKNKSLHDLDASLAVMLTNIEAYYTGNLHAYRPVAVELRKLLCDTQRGNDISLIKRFLPDLRLHPLPGNQKRIDEFTVLYIPGKIKFDGQGGSSLNIIFNEASATLPLNEWLEQNMFDISTTIRDFIRSVSDKEGAHSDKSYDPILRKTKSVVLSDDTLTAKAILAIGRYVIKTLAIRMINDNIVEISAHILGEYEIKGRGAAVLSLSEFAARFSEGVPIKYEPATTVEAYTRRDVNKCEAMRKILQTCQPSDYFLLLVLDLNGEIWLYRQAMRTVS